MPEEAFSSGEGSSVWWQPFSGPQQQAYESQADEVFYGGAAGGGKTDLILGLAVKAHRNSIIFRREYPQLRAIIERSREIIGGAGSFNANDNLWRLSDGRRLEFGAVQREQDKSKYQGRPHDLKAFDELVHFTQEQYQFLIAWNRTAVPGQRCRVVATGNPPVPGQGGDWILRLWAPWLDPQFPNPAEPGELRWYAMLDGEMQWLPSGEPFERTNARGLKEKVQPRSRTFIPAKVEDNPALMASGYDAVLESLPEPLRSQLRYGDFAATAEDDPWQVIPTKWVLEAMRRGREREGPDVPLSCVGVDVARGGKDQTVLARRYGNWFAPLQKHPGKSTPDGKSVAALALGALEESRAPVNIDAISIGSSPLDILRENEVPVNAVNFAAAALDTRGKPRTDRSGKFRLRNVRAWAYWSLREALDPRSGNELALPDDRELLADLCAHRYTLTAAGIGIEAKDEVKKRIGRSPDCGDAVALAHLPTAIPLDPEIPDDEGPGVFFSSSVEF